MTRPGMELPLAARQGSPPQNRNMSANLGCGEPARRGKDRRLRPGMSTTHVMLTSHRNGLTRSELFDASPQLTCLHRTAEGRKLPFTAEDRKPAFTAVRSMSESLPPERS